jgi:hypothetical protein
MGETAHKILNKDEYIYQGLDLKESFEKKISEAKEINFIFTEISKEMETINNYGSKLRRLKEELSLKFSK